MMRVREEQFFMFIFHNRSLKAHQQHPIRMANEKVIKHFYGFCKMFFFAAAALSESWIFSTSVCHRSERTHEVMPNCHLPKRKPQKMLLFL